MEKYRNSILLFDYKVIKHAAVRLRLISLKSVSSDHKLKSFSSSHLPSISY